MTKDYSKPAQTSEQAQQRLFADEEYRQDAIDMQVGIGKSMGLSIDQIAAILEERFGVSDYEEEIKNYVTS